jgi:ubiquinol-cytochrome c reductase subunit 6
MGFADLLSSFFTEVHAEAPEEEPPTDTPSTDGDKEEGGEEGGEEKEEEPEEEEEEEEPEDIKPKLEEECARSSQCRPYKHHFEDCVERVTAAAEAEEKGPKEDCVEECEYLFTGGRE